MRYRRSLVHVLAGLGLGCFAMPAAAQSATDAAAAEALFVEGRQLLRSGQTQLACDKLEASQRLDAGMGTLFHLADCYERLGRTASAWASFLELAAWARKELRSDREQVARERAADLEPRLSHLIVAVPETSRVDGLTIKRGTSQLYPASWDSPLPVDPGTIRITAEAPGHRVWVGQIVVPPDGKSVTIQVPFLERQRPLGGAQGATTATATPAPDSGLDSGPSPWSSGTTWGWVAGGVGAVGVGLGSYFGLRAFAQMNESDSECKDGCSPRGAKLADRARTSADLSTAAFAVGVAGLAAGVYLLLVHDNGAIASMAPGGRSVGAPIPVDFVVNAGGAKLAYGGSWQ